MDDGISSISAFIVQHSGWAGPTILALTFGESLVIIGMLIPATALMIAVGGMVGTGLLDPLPVLLWTVAGAVLGDWVSFAIGRRVGRSAFQRPPFNRYRAAAAKARLIFRRYGLLSVLLGRFLGPVRATVPLVAGIMKMPTRTFQLANVASALIWVPALLAPGYFAASSVGGFRVTEAHLAALAGVMILISVLGSVLSMRLLGRSPRTARRRLQRQGLS